MSVLAAGAWAKAPLLIPPVTAATRTVRTPTLRVRACLGFGMMPPAEGPARRGQDVLRCRRAALPPQPHRPLGPRALGYSGLHPAGPGSTRRREATAQKNAKHLLELKMY